MLKLETRTVFHCVCELCGHEWDSFSRDKVTGRLISQKPKRCARCKYLTWNREDRRRKDPFKFAPPKSIGVGDGKVPQLRPKQLLEAFTENKAILEQLIADVGPCEHPKNCVCKETEALAKTNRQIEVLNRLAGRKESEAVEEAAS